ncbi:MAG TPA: pseudouridine synthase [Solirubrobacteraceae bacterium]|nr:pseudouridine synthase [Solirubrobacteraceae bacterium]
MRLAKHLAHAGVASRRAAETLIRAGRVTVDGETVRDPARDVAEADRVELDGRALPASAKNVVYALNKPLGVVSTARDTHGRPTVVGLVPVPGLRLYPVGRLDVDTSGLILLTNDGQLAERLTHPRYEVPKTYRARVGAGPVSDAELRILRAGVRLDDGLTARARARRLRGPQVGPDRARGETIELTIREGRNRQVRRMFDAIGHPVLELQRIAFGSLALGDLAPGAHRRLSDAEVSRLRASARLPRRASRRR